MSQPSDHNVSEQIKQSLMALGRRPNIEGLNIAEAGLVVTEKGVLGVNEFCQTSVSHIYAVGGMSGPTRACLARHGAGQPGHLPCTEPAIRRVVRTDSIGHSYASRNLLDRARRGHGQCPLSSSDDRTGPVQRSGAWPDFRHLRRVVADPTGERFLVGTRIIGEGATELIHVGQLALRQGSTIDAFIDNIFNFPTLAEADRVVALGILGQRRKRQTVAAA